MERIYYQKYISILKNKDAIISSFFVSIIFSLIFWPLLSSILCLILSVYWLIFLKKEFSLGSYRSRFMLLFCSLYLLVIIGLLYSDNMKEGIFKLQQKSPLLIFPLIAGTTSIISDVVYIRILKAIKWFTFLGCLICTTFGSYKYVADGETRYIFGYGINLLKDMPAHVLGLCCVMSIAHILESSLLLETKHRDRLIDLAIGSFMFLFLLLMGNRGILICVAAVTFFYTFRLIRKILIRILIIVGVALLFIAAIIVNPSLKKQWNDMVDFSENNTIQLDKNDNVEREWSGKAIRLSVWKCALDIVGEYPVMGVGTGDEQSALQEVYKERKLYVALQGIEYNAHNQYLQETIAHGIVGLIVFASCLFLPLLFKRTGSTSHLYTVFLLCFAFVCLTESVLELSKGVIFYALFNSVFMFRGGNKLI